ncbi:MAG: sensor histidine kinase [Acidimicrobiia bacterium]|nr:sensor histidine kinase [Acidimicrobiia bacterium]
MDAAARRAALPLLAAGLAAITTLDLVQHYDLAGAAALVVGAAAGLLTLLAPRRALAAWGLALALVTLVATMAHPVSSAEPWPWAVTSTGLLVVVFVFVARRHRDRRVLGALWLGLLATGAGLLLLVPGRGAWSGLLPTALLTALVVVAAGALGERDIARRRLSDQERVNEVERQRRTLLEERARIARELHDVVAHHMSVIAVQADSAPYRLPDLSPGARDELASIAASARQSLAEMRRLLGVLRDDLGAHDLGARDLAPQPGFDGLESLVDAARRAGVDAHLAPSAAGADGHPGSARAPSSAAVGLAAYRIVQEALSNVIRHAPGARVDVAVEAGAGPTTVTVLNGPPPPGAFGSTSTPSNGTSGHGLVGMRERARLLQGTLEARPLPDGGFEVTASLPDVDAP